MQPGRNLCLKVYNAPMEEIPSASRKQIKIVALVTGLVILLIVLVLSAFYLFRPQNLVTPIPEGENGVRIVFVTPEPTFLPSPTATASASATPRTSPRASVRASARATPRASTAVSGSPRTSPTTSTTPRPSSSTTASPNASATPRPS